MWNKGYGVVGWLPLFSYTRCVLYNYSRCCTIQEIVYLYVEDRSFCLSVSLFTFLYSCRFTLNSLKGVVYNGCWLRVSSEQSFVRVLLKPQRQTKFLTYASTLLNILHNLHTCSLTFLLHIRYNSRYISRHSRSYSSIYIRSCCSEDEC